MVPPHDKRNQDFDKLGVTKKSTKDEIKKAYYTKAKEMHPDHRHDDPEIAEKEFKELSQAYINIMNAKGDQEIPLEEKTPSRPEVFRKHNTFQRKQEFDFDWGFQDIIELFQSIFTGRVDFNRQLRKNQITNPDLDDCSTGHLPTTICLRCSNR